jgi:hypothetical protein
MFSGNSTGRTSLSHRKLDKRRMLVVARKPIGQ